MSLHMQWPDLLKPVIDEVVRIASAHGAAEVFVHGPTLRVMAPRPASEVSPREREDHVGTYRRGLPRSTITLMLLAAFIDGATDR
jgi:hypothetical protein